jgi:hypothetical protein
MKTSRRLQPAGAVFGMVLVFSAAAAQAGEPSCERPELAWENWRDDVISRNAGIRYFELSGEGRDALLRAYSCDGESDTCPPDRVMVLYCSGNANVLVAFVKGGCITMAEDVAIEDYLRFVGGGEPC